MNKFTLINEARSRIKVFIPFEDVSKPSHCTNVMMNSYWCVYKKSIKPVMKDSRVETIENARKENNELWEQGWEKTSVFGNFFRLPYLYHNLHQYLFPKP